MHLLVQNKLIPFSPTHSHPGSTYSNSSTSSSDVHPLVLSEQVTSSSRRSSSADYSRQMSEMSIGSVESSLNDNPALLKSLTKFQRYVGLTRQLLVIVMSTPDPMRVLT